MAPGRQTSLTQVEWAGRVRRTRRAELPGQTGPVVPRVDLLALVEPLRPGAGRRGRQPWPAETPPGTRPARCWLNLSDAACEDACHGSLSARDFVGCRYRVPDACDPRGPPPPPGGERRREGPARRRSRPLCFVKLN